MGGGAPGRATVEEQVGRASTPEPSALGSWGLPGVPRPSCPGHPASLIRPATMTGREEGNSRCLSQRDSGEPDSAVSPCTLEGLPSLHPVTLHSTPSA